MNLIEEKIEQALLNHPDDVVAQSGVKGLTQEDVLVGKTPSGIMNHWLNRMLEDSESAEQMAQEEREAEQKEFPLLPYSQLVWEMEQMMPGIYSFPFIFQYDATQISTSQLNKAIAKAIAHHPVFKGNEPYYHLQANEDGALGKLCITLNRILGDGYSFGILLEDICKAYQGLELAPDYYFRYLQQVETHKVTNEYAHHKEWLENRYGTIACPVHPTLDFPLDTEDLWMAAEYFLEVPNADNEKVCLATAMAIMDYCGTDEAALTWAYLGRENEQENHIFGSLHKDIPMLIHRASTIEEYINEVKSEMQQGIIHSDYPITLTHPHKDIWNYAVNVLQQPQWQDIDTHGLAFIPQFPSGDEPAIAYSLLDVEIVPEGITVKYSATHYKEESIIRFAQFIKQNLIKISEKA